VTKSFSVDFLHTCGFLDQGIGLSDVGALITVASGIRFTLHISEICITILDMEVEYPCSRILRKRIIKRAIQAIKSSLMIGRQLIRGL
jgi:hypothetical protein